MSEYCDHGYRPQRPDDCAICEELASLRAQLTTQSASLAEALERAERVDQRLKLADALADEVRGSMAAGVAVSLTVVVACRAYDSASQVKP